MKKDYYKKIAPCLPLAPGCYVFVDKDENVLYVGKSKCLKKRVASYFGTGVFEKFKVMLNSADRIDVEETKTDIEALLLEHKLIKKFRPMYNSKMRQDYQKWYVKFADGIQVTLDADWPGFFIGPFSHKEAALEAVDILGKNFRLPTCNKILNGITRMCLRGHMKNCFAPCENKESGTENYHQALNFLQGSYKETLDGVKRKMQFAIEKMEYEKAAEFRELYVGLKQLSYFAANTIPNLEQKRYIVYLKSHHEDCFMLAYLDDGECVARVLLDGVHEIEKINEFAGGIVASRHSPIPSEENRAFVRALVEISAIRRFYEIDAEFTCDMLKEMIK